MSAWVLLTIAGAFLQNFRSLLQRQLTEDLSVNGAAYVRFLFALPFAWLFLALLSQVSQVAAPSLDLEFWLYVLSGAVTQIIATSALVAAVSGSHFALGTALSKTEAVQAALLGLVILGEGVAPMALAGIGISLVGVFLLSGNIRPKDLVRADRRVWFGVLAGTCLALRFVIEVPASRCWNRPLRPRAFLKPCWLLHGHLPSQSPCKLPSWASICVCLNQANSRQWLTVGGRRSW